MNQNSLIRLTPALKFTLNSMPRGKNYAQPISNSCNVPSHHISIDSNLDCFLCSCEGWLPIPVGNILDFNCLEDVWKSSEAKMLQNDIAEKKFTWCAVTHCGIINHAQNLKNYSLSINIDDSCNLACPSCRRELRMLNSGPEFNKKQQAIHHLMLLLEKFNHPIIISFGGSGDALASHIIRPLIQTYSPKPGQTFSIGTNGLLLKKLMPTSLIRTAIVLYNISVDAGSAKVYEQVRRPGKWQILIDNLEWLSNNRLKSHIALSFTVQKTNFKDIPAFTELCQRLGVIGTLQALNDWGTWNSKSVKNPDTYTLLNGSYPDHDVANSTHPEHKDFLKILNEARAKKILNINPYFDQFQ